jgi:hypothetical protein
MCHGVFKPRQKYEKEDEGDDKKPYTRKQKHKQKYVH